MDPFISIVIPIHNAESTLGSCLDAIFRSDFKDFELIVVNDGSSDASLEIADRYPVKIVELAGNRGAAYARNRGGAEARGEVLFFIDADVTVQPTTLDAVATIFKGDDSIDAVFGSYTKETPCRDFFSSYKNYIHHYTHQNSKEDAATFWGACGAIRKEAFSSVAGFDEAYPGATVEDIDLGYRLKKAGGRILLRKGLQVTHLKRYNALTLARSDIFHRAIPWTRLMLRERIFRRDLNLRNNNIASVVLSFPMAALILAVPFLPFALVAVAPLAAIFIGLNRHFFRFIHRERGFPFTIGTILWYFISCLYGGTSLVIGTLQFLLTRPVRHAGTPPGNRTDAAVDGPNALEKDLS